MKIANRMEKLAPSLTLSITALWKNELKAAGKDILSFSAGEPDFDTPQVVKDAAIKTINEGKKLNIQQLRVLKKLNKQLLIS